MPKYVLIAIAGGLLTALLHLSTETGNPGTLIFAYFTLLPLFMVGLAKGLAAAAISGTVALVVTGVAANLTLAAIFTLAYAVPAVAMVRLALLNRQTPEGPADWYPAGRMMSWLTGYGAAALIAFGVFAGGSPAGMEATFREGIETSLEGLATGEDGTGPADIAAQIAPHFPALIITSWLIMVTINGSLAQRFLRRLKWNLRPSPQMSAFELPQWMAIALAISVLAWLAGGQGALGFIGWNLTMVFSVPYFFMGLAVIHTLSRPWSARTLALVIFYLFLIVFRWPIAIVAALGLVEQWAGLRQRFAGMSGNQSGNQEEDQ
ncbi:MAG: DUF2232 domain-containing protein [Proteobacteria bacterium]|nr:DUF2232 domain-containing protein [Pseudomonadota bacterium]